MDKLTEVYNDLHNAGVMMFSCPMHFSSDTAAVTIEVNGDYGIFLDTDLITTEAEENAAVAHEAGHIFTGSTHPLCSPFQIVQQHENRADKWAIKKLIPKNELDAAVSAGHTEIWDLAEYFDLPEHFIRKAVHFYKYNNLSL